MDALAALRLQIEWGADEALQSLPADRLRPDVPAVEMPSEPAPKPAARTATGSDAASRARAAAEAAHGLEELAEALRVFDVFGLAATATSLVFGSGSRRPAVALIGDAPGEEEDVSGVAFSGPDGRLLDRMLGSIGLDRERVWLTTVVPWRPPGGRTPSAAEIACCLPFLHRQLALLRPPRLVTLGALPARALLGRPDSISRLRGRWMQAAVPGLPEPVPLLPMLHPTQLRTRPELKAAAWQDLRLLRRSIGVDDEFVNVNSSLSN